MDTSLKPWPNGIITQVEASSHKLNLRAEWVLGGQTDSQVVKKAISMHACAVDLHVNLILTKLNPSHCK